MRFLCFFLFFLLSCDKGSDLIVEETGFTETTDIFLLNNLDPDFVYPENLQYMSSREVKSSICLDINRHIDVSITRPAYRQNNVTDLDKPLQGHTCYSEENSKLIGGDYESGGISFDQGFDVSKISDGEFSFPFYNLCMEVENPGQRSDLVLRECDQNPNQKFILEDDGKIKPVNDLGLCLTASASYDWYGGGYDPIFIVRELFLSPCNPSFAKRQSWGIRPSG